MERANVRLEGQHVVLRPLRVEDAAMTLAWRLGDRTTHLNRGAQTVAEQAAWIASRPDDEVNLVIELRSGVPVGMISLIGIDTVHKRAEPARFLIGEPAAVKGVPAAVEALKLLYQLAFDELQLQRIYGTVAADNHLMIKWHKSMGMQVEGRLRQHLFLDGHFQDAVCVGLLEDEFRTLTLPRMNALIRSSQR